MDFPIGFTHFFLLVFPELLGAGVIAETRRVGKSRMFKLNEENPAVQKLMQLDAAFSNYFINKKVREVLV